MPTDASPETVAWDRYIAGTHKIPYDPKSSSGGATIVTLERVSPAIFVFTFFPVLMSLQILLGQIEFSPPDNFRTGKTDAMCRM